MLFRSYNPPLKPHEPDRAVHEKHHKLHYKIAGLEAELTEAHKGEAGGG